MNDLEKMILDEIATLNDMRLIDVLGFIRYLKAEKPVRSEWVEEWFEHALESIHTRAEEFQITPGQLSDQTSNLVNKPSSNG